jgi:mono/diheme cytochrome c family protein
MRLQILVATLAAGSAMGALAQCVPDASFTDTQREGLRLFSQTCAVCHTPVQQQTPQHGPALSHETLGGDEVLMRQYIGNGTLRMPGFRYYFKPAQIDAIVAYIKTLPPQPTAAGAR